MTDLQDMFAKIKAFREERNWTNEDPKDIALSLVLEATELLELFQWKTGEEVLEEARLKGPICDELVDVLWWLLVMTDRLGVDLSTAFERKLDKNGQKYPIEKFGKQVSREERWRAYYKIKADTRGGHPLHEKKTKKEE